MDFLPTLLPARFIKRYKRFFADIETPEGPLTVHVPNTGSLKGCLIQGSDCLYSPSNDPKRKLKGTLQFLKVGESWVGVNTSLPNQFAKHLWESKSIPHWRDFHFLKLEHKINAQTRLDLVLAPNEESFLAGRGLHFVEIKNVTMADKDLALFPDAVTTRGQKHLNELMELQIKGFTTEILFMVQRTDCQKFSACAEIDPEYARLLKEAQLAGVRITALSCHVNQKKGVELVNSFLKVEI